MVSNYLPCVYNRSRLNVVRIETLLPYLLFVAEVEIVLTPKYLILCFTAFRSLNVFITRFKRRLCRGCRNRNCCCNYR